MNLQVSFPSETPGALVDLKKGRATISFCQAEVDFAIQLFLLVSPYAKKTGVTVEVPPSLPTPEDQDTTPILD